MKKKGLTIILSVFAIAFYAAILAYIFYAMFPVWFLANFNSALMFELIGLVFLAFTVMEGVISKSVKVYHGQKIKNKFQEDKYDVRKQMPAVWSTD